jgi:hypothetical protein
MQTTLPTTTFSLMVGIIIVPSHRPGLTAISQFIFHAPTHPSTCTPPSAVIDLLVLLQSLIRLAVLAKAVAALVGSALGSIAAAGGTAAAGGSSTGLAAFLACLVWVDLAVGELAGADALVGLAVLAETVVLCMYVVREKGF